MRSATIAFLVCLFFLLTSILTLLAIAQGWVEAPPHARHFATAALCYLAATETHKLGRDLAGLR